MNWHAIEEMGAEWIRAEKAQVTSVMALVVTEQLDGNVFLFLEENGKRTELYAETPFVSVDEAQELMDRSARMLTVAEWALHVCEYADLRDVWPFGGGVIAGLDAVDHMMQGMPEDFPPAAAVRRRIAVLRARESGVAA